MYENARYEIGLLTAFDELNNSSHNDNVLESGKTAQYDCPSVV